MSKIICTARHNARLFDGWPAEPSVEISTLKAAGGLRFISQVYDDAADQGFILVNGDTKGEAVWILAEELTAGRGSDREVCGWLFRAAPETSRRVPALRGVTLTVFND